MGKDGEALPGAEKINNYSLKLNFFAKKSTIDQNLVQCWQWTTLHTRPMESNMWKQAMLTRTRPTRVQHTEIFQTKATKSYKKVSFLTAQKIRLF